MDRRGGGDDACRGGGDSPQQFLFALPIGQPFVVDSDPERPSHSEQQHHNRRDNPQSPFEIQNPATHLEVVQVKHLVSNNVLHR